MSTKTRTRPFEPGQRVKYQRRPKPKENEGDPRYRLGCATVLYEWLALDVTAVKVELDNGKVLDLFPELGDKVRPVE